MQDLSKMSTEELLRMRRAAQQQPAPQPLAPRGPVFGPAPAPPPPPTPAQQAQIQNDAVRTDIAIRGEERQQQAFEQGAQAEQQATFLLSRIGGGIDDLNYIAKTMPGGKSAPSLGEAFLYDNFGPNSVFTRGLTDEGRRAVEDVQMDILDSLLTLGTGAAYNKEQLAGQRAAYFPQFNDGPEAIALKRRRLERLFNDAIARAGPLADRLSQYKGQFLAQADQPAPRQPDRDDVAPLGFRSGLDGSPDDPFDRTRYLQERFGIDPGKETRLVGLFNANRGNPNVTADMVARFYRDSGVVTDDSQLPPREVLERVAQDLRSGGNAPFVRIDTSEAERAYVSGLDTIIDRAGFNPEAQSSTLANTARQGAAFEGFDEITGVVNAVAEGLQGNNPIDGYRTGRDVTRRMIERGDAANPVTGFVGRLAGGIPTGVLGSAGRVNSLSSAARVGAVEGGIVGFNAGDGLGGSALGAAFGAPTGALLGVGFQAGGNKIQNALRNRGPQVDVGQVQGVVDAGARRRVTVRRPDVDPSIRQQRAAVQQTEQGRAAIAAADSNDIGEIETALIRDLGGRAGTQRTEAATAIQTGVKGARDRVRQEASQQYRLASQEAGKVQVEPRKALDVIDAQIEELAQNGAERNAAKIQYLRSTRRDIARRGGLSIDGLRAMRTELRKDLENAGIYTSDFERRMGMVLDGISDDITRTLDGTPAAARYAEADRLWKQQAEFGSEVGDLLLGKKGGLAPGQAADRLMNWARSDPARLARLMNETDDATKEEIRALVASQIGRQANGNFSLAAFLTQTSGGRGGALSPAAVRSLFGEEGVRAIADLRILSQAKVDAASATNRSQTGGVVRKGMNGLRRLVLGGFGFTAAADAGGGMGLATLAAGGATIGGEIVDRLGRERAIRLLLNPDFTGWLRRLPQTNNPQAINRSFAGLRSIASRSPVMMTDVQALERVLVEAVNDNTTRIAAEPSGTDELRGRE